jgi:hypothetical protein
LLKIVRLEVSTELITEAAIVCNMCSHILADIHPCLMVHISYHHSQSLRAPLKMEVEYCSPQNPKVLEYIYRLKQASIWRNIACCYAALFFSLSELLLFLKLEIRVICLKLHYTIVYSVKILFLSLSLLPSFLLYLSLFVCSFSVSSSSQILYVLHYTNSMELIHSVQAASYATT